MNTETELKRLESDVKSLKMAYPIAGSKAKFYVTKSSVIDVSGQQEVRIRFRPNYGRGKTSFTKLTASVKVDDSTVEYSPEQVNEPQDGSGDTIIRINCPASATYHITVIASGTSPGAFSVIQ